MPPVTPLAGLAEGLGQGAGQFSNALARVMQNRQARERADRKRERGLLMDRLELAATPGVSVGRPETAELAETAGAMGGSLMGMPGMTGGLARTMGRRARPSATAQEMGELGGDPVYFDPAAAREATTEPNLPPWREEGFASEEDYIDYQRRLAEAKDPPEEAGTPTYNVPGMGLELPYTEGGLETGVGLRQRFGLMDGRGGGGGEGGGPPDEGDLPSYNEARRMVQDYLYTSEGVPSTSITPEQEGNLIRGLTRGDPGAYAKLDSLVQEATASPDTAGPDERLAEEDEGDIPLVPDWAEDLGGGIGRFTRGLVRTFRGSDESTPGSSVAADTLPADTAQGTEPRSLPPDSVIQQQADALVEAYGSAREALDALAGRDNLTLAERQVLSRLRGMAGGG